jgi:kynureninase
LRLSDKIIQATNGGELVSPRPAAQRSGTVILQFSGRQASVLSALHEQQIHVDSRAKGIRLSPHLCNSAEQINALIKHIF